MVVKSLQDCLTTLIAIIYLDLLVLVSDEFLDIDTTLTGHSQHNTALVGDLSSRKLWLLDLKIGPLLCLLLAHLIFGFDGRFELIEARGRRQRELKNVLPEEGA